MSDEESWGRTVSGGRSLWVRFKEGLFGGPRRLGFWTVPLFVAVGLLGAVLAGSLAAVYYAQKVDALRAETEAARRDLATAVEQVSEAAEQARTDIQDEVAAVRDELAVTPPIEDATAAGVASVRAVAVVRPAQEPSPPPAGPGGTEEPQEPARPAETVTRTGSAFAVVVGEGQAFFVTAFAVVADPQRPGFPVGQAELTYGGATVGSEVHSWDADRDLALLRVTGLPRVEVPEWRPEDDEVTTGARLFAVGLTPTGTLSQVGVSVGAAEPGALLLDTALPDVARGGPVVDGGGRVVAVASTSYAPYGAGGAANPAIPVRVLCESLIRCGAGDVGEGGGGE